MEECSFDLLRQSTISGCIEVSMLDSIDEARLVSAKHRNKDNKLYIETMCRRHQISMKFFDSEDHIQKFNILI